MAAKAERLGRIVANPVLKNCLAVQRDSDVSITISFPMAFGMQRRLRLNWRCRRIKTLALVGWRVAIKRRAQILPVQLAGRCGIENVGRRHQGQMGLRAGASADEEELGLDHFEGRSWQGLHRHALMTMIVYQLRMSISLVWLLWQSCLKRQVPPHKARISAPCVV